MRLLTYLWHIKEDWHGVWKIVHYFKAVAMFCGVSTAVLPPAWICISGTHNYDKHIKNKTTSAAYTTSGWWTPSQGQTSGHEQSIRQQSPGKVWLSLSTEKITRQPSNEDNTQVREHVRCLIRSITLHPVTVRTNSPLAPMLPRHCHTQW